MSYVFGNRSRLASRSTGPERRSLGMQRICWTCEQFKGDGPGDAAFCRKFGVRVNGMDGARTCLDWSRKVAKQ